jgi:hypothetical protein
VPLITLLLLIIGGTSSFCQTRGYELGWMKTSENQYKIQLGIYHNCKVGVTGLPAIQKIQVEYNNQSKLIEVQQISVKDISQLYSNIKCDPCVDANCQFTEKGSLIIYEGVLEVSDIQENQWINIAFKGNEHNPDVTNIVNGQSSYISATINHDKISIGEELMYKHPIKLVYSIGNEVNLNPMITHYYYSKNGIGDEVRSELYQPQTDKTTAITYQKSFTFNKPLQYDGFPGRGKNNIYDDKSGEVAGIYTNPTSGDISFIPSKMDTQQRVLIGFQTSIYGWDDVKGIRY